MRSKCSKCRKRFQADQLKKPMLFDPALVSAAGRTGEPVIPRLCLKCWEDNKARSARRAYEETNEFTRDISTKWLMAAPLTGEAVLARSQPIQLSHVLDKEEEEEESLARPWVEDLRSFADECGRSLAGYGEKTGFHVVSPPGSHPRLGVDGIYAVPALLNTLYSGVLDTLVTDGGEYWADFFRSWRGSLYRKDTTSLVITWEPGELRNGH